METSAGTFRRAVLNLPAFQLAMYYCRRARSCGSAANMMSDSQLQVGELTGFLSYVLQVMNSLMLISNVFLMLTRSLASARRIRRGAGGGTRRSPPRHGRRDRGRGRQRGFRERRPSNTARTRQEYALSGVDLHIKARARRWASSAAPARPRARWCSSSPGSTTPPRARCAVGGRDVREYDLARAARRRGAWCCKRTSSSPALYATTCAGATRTPTTRR